MDQATYSLAEMPFELNEHDFVGEEGKKNPYILKQQIRRRLNKIDLNWRETQPVLLFQDADIVVVTLSIIANGVERFGVGTGIIQRTSKSGKDYTGYTLALARAKAFKTAASDALARAALELGLGWYLRLPQAKGIHDQGGLQTFLKKLEDQRAAKEMLDQLEQAEQEAPPQRPPHVDENGEIHRDDPTAAWQGTWYAEEKARQDFWHWLDTGKLSIKHVAELTGKEPWEFATGKDACEAIVEARKPAQPRNGSSEQPASVDSPAKTEDPFKTLIHLAREIKVAKYGKGAFQYTAICDKANVPTVGGDLYRAAGFSEGTLERWKNTGKSGPLSEPVEIHCTRDENGNFKLIKVVAPKAVLDDQQARNVPTANPEPSDKELADIPF